VNSIPPAWTDTTRNGRGNARKLGPKTWWRAVKYSRNSETPMAVMREAIRGAFRSGLYATRSMATASAAQPRTAAPKTAGSGRAYRSMA